MHREVSWCVSVCFAAYTELAMSTVKQSQAIPFTGPYSLLVCHLRNLTGEAVHVCTEGQLPIQFSVHALKLFLPFYASLIVAACSLVSGDVEELDGTEKNTLKILKNITLIHEVGMVLLEVRTINLKVHSSCL